MADGYRIPDLIIKKRDKQTLAKSEIDFFVQEVVKHSVQDAQLGAMLMAIYLNGLNDNEITNLTDSMVNSGEKMTWPTEWRGKLVDKHSTGGVGDKVSLVLAPALAACGMKVPMISGRGLGHTGGTLDKMEAIPGFSVDKSREDMEDILRKVGCCIVGQTEKLVPADKIMYATRDVTGTVNNIGLISGSIMSKKVAENVDALVLDVKCGEGAMMQKEEDAKTLATQMMAIGNGLGIKTIALITSMDSPLGNMVGNALEVAETIQTLNGNGPHDLVDLVTQLGGNLLFVSGNATSVQDGCDQIEDKLKGDLRALQCFRDMIVEQGVEPAVADKLCTKNADVWEVLTKSKHQTSFNIDVSGYIHGINALKCAHVSGMLGAGRSKSSDKLNFAVGVELLAKVGQQISIGDPWIKVYHETEVLPDKAVELLKGAIDVQMDPPKTIHKSRVLDVLR